MKNDDFEGLREMSGKLYRMMGGLPRDPNALIELEKRMEKEDELNRRARLARENIRRMRAERKKQREFNRQMRHEEILYKIDKIKKFFRG